MQDAEGPTRVVVITRANVGRVQRWRGVRSGIRTYLQARVDGEWCQVVETRSDPECLPPRMQRLRAGEYTWTPSRRRSGENVTRKTGH
ncbi:MAG: hypothetical protein M0C28_23995 [Candidatus Moduliflexus flocculans]|nr:hypothetical protein [Candidatus Moduliflexus flocculans]